MTQLTHFGWDYKVDSFEDIMEILKSHYFTVDTIMEEVRFLIVASSYNIIITFCIIYRYTGDAKVVYYFCNTRNIIICLITINNNIISDNYK